MIECAQYEAIMKWSKFEGDNCFYLLFSGSQTSEIDKMCKNCALDLLYNVYI